MELATLLDSHLPRFRLRELLGRFPQLHIGVMGDFFLDAYYDCDAQLEERSLETGEKCYQVVRTRRQAGAAGTVAANLVALGVGQVSAVGYCGDDGEGYELRRALLRLGVDLSGFPTCPQRFTPTYGKPTYVSGRGRHMTVTRELQRIDIKNRQRTPVPLQEELIQHVRTHAHQWHGLIIVDQVSEADCGTITRRVRQFVNRELSADPRRILLADSRERLRLFRNVILKPNQREAAMLTGLAATAAGEPAPEVLARALSQRTGRPVFLTRGEQGLVAAHRDITACVPAVRLPPPLDPVGAGDSTAAALVAALAAGAQVIEASLLAVLTASLTVQQLGTTGTASPSRLLRRHREVLHDR